MGRDSRKRRLGRVILGLALGGVVLAGCGDDDEGAASGSPSEVASDVRDGAGGEAMTVVATDYDFEGMEDSLEGGVVTITFRNEGEKPHELGLMQLTEELTVEEFDSAVQPVFEGGAFPEVIENHTGIFEIDPGESVTSTITLPEGTYALYCSITDEAEDDEEEGAEGEDGAAEEAAPPHYELGMYQTVRVEGDNGVALPSGATVVARDYTFETNGLTAGDQVVTFRNDSDEQFHHAVLFEWPEGTDEAAAEAAWKVLAELGEDGTPPEGTPEPEDVAGSQVFGPGGGGTFSATLQAGRTYSVVCFVQDREGGPPHAFGHDMAAYFTVE